MRVLIVEDDPQIAESIAVNLHHERHDTARAADGRAGLALARETSPAFDVLVLDLMLPLLDGFGVLSELRAGGVLTPVLMLSAMDSVNDRVRGLRAGADDYLIKPFAFDELHARLLALVRRTANLGGIAPPGEPATSLTVADLTLDRITRRARRGPEEIELQPKEFALLEYLMCNAGRTLTRAMILEHVWHCTFDPQTNVVDVLILRLRNKIDRQHHRKLIHTLRGIGYELRLD